MQVAEKMRKYVVEKGLKQSAIAQKANMREDTLSTILNGKRKLTVDEYITLCIAMGVSPMAFIQDTVA